MVHIQKTHYNQIATLFLVTTPIGDQIEISPRALQVLQQVDLIFCENTKHSQKLFTKWKFQPKFSSLHKFNENDKSKQAIQRLCAGFNIALISCAGSPLIADPGYRLVVAVINEGFNVTSVGINSPLLAALICSGIPCHKFLFHNFLLPSRLQKVKQITQLLTTTETIVCYESVHKLKTTLKIMQTIAPQRRFCLAREMSKQHETFYRGILEELDFNQITFKGEFTLVIAGADAKIDMLTKIFVDKIRALDLTKQQILQIGKQLGYSRKELYKVLNCKELDHE